MIRRCMEELTKVTIRNCTPWLQALTPALSARGLLLASWEVMRCARWSDPRPQQTLVVVQVGVLNLKPAAGRKLGTAMVVAR